ncbi:MAG TPA: PadR family transcriptional regulator [Solirubrobacteraceae bacterium]|nr:PadR family transcriptional regulator [Solirubrobacteraceae bacterium]
MRIKLTPTSAIVLGLLEHAGEATPYDLKTMVAASVGNFWSVPHSALYAEPERLARAGYLEERRETGGRRRRRYALTDLGLRALDEWRRETSAGLPELRDLALLKVFFGADPARVAADQLAAHRAKLAQYEAMRRAGGGDAPRGPALTLEAGIRHEREWVTYWEQLASGELAHQRPAAPPRS